jgi:hypothetical protein
MDREDIVNLFVVTNVALPKAALPLAPPKAGFLDDKIPF